MRENKANCEELLEKVQSLAENTERRNDTSLQVRETQINGLDLTNPTYVKLKAEKNVLETKIDSLRFLLCS